VALDGLGTQQDPWLIQSLEDFNDFAADANYWDGWTRLETDVNLAGLTYTTAVIAPDTDNSNHSFDGTFFDGSFDGNGKRIFNLTIQGGANDYLGLFGCIIGGQVSNLGLEGCNISGDDYVGGLMGENYYGGIILNCYSIGSVSGDDYVGGLVGGNSSIYLIGYCHSSGSVIGHEYVGGLVGINSSGVLNCCSGSYVDGITYVGGLVGENSGGVYNCSSTGDVNGLDGDIGGLVGINYRTVSYCYSTGNVSGTAWSCVGGLVGVNGHRFLYLEGVITSCYSTGNVNGFYVGGLVGVNGAVGFINIPGYINNSYSTGTVNGILYVGGLVGAHVWGDIDGSFWDIETSGQLESDGGTGLPTTEMQTMNTFTDANWDFINVWNIGENQTYPYLRVYLPSDINKDGIVNFLDLSITANQWMEEQ
jgi:hypothetical protein